MKNYLKLLPFFIILLFTVLMVIKINKTGTIKDSDTIGISEMVGHQMPDFKGQNLFDEKDMISLKDLKGNYAIINFFASWCLTCAEEHHLFTEFSDIRKGLVLVGVNWRDKKNDATNWLMKNSNPFDLVISDELGKIGISAGIRGIPETFLVNPDGKILMHYKGNIDEEFIKKTREIVTNR